MSRIGRIHQIYSTISINLLACSMGAGMVLPLYSLKVWASDESDFESGPITVKEQRLIVSLYNVGGILGAILFAYISKIAGRKTILKVSSVLHFFGYILIAYANNAMMIMVSRFILGMADSGISITIPFVVCEIAEDKIRGSLGSIFAMMIGIGTLISYSLSLIMSYYYVVWVLLLLPILFLIFSQFWHESPYYLMLSGDYNRSKDSLIFYRGVKSADRNSVQVELDSLQQFIKFHNAADENIKISDFLTTAARKSIIIGAVLVALKQFSGYYFMNVQAGDILQQTETISPEIAAILIEFLQIFGIVFAIIFVDSAGRKLMISISSIGVAFGMLIYGISEQFMFTKNLSIVGLSITVFCGGFGILSLPYVVISEICPSNIRGPVISVCVTLSWTFTFILNKLDSIFLQAFGPDAIIYYFTVNCILGACFVIFYMPETKKKSFLEIAHIMKN